MEFVLNGGAVDVPDDGMSLLDVLRERLGIHSAKDGCSPQGQCGCCTVLVDGQPRVACVTPARRVAGREVTTIEGLEPARRDAMADAFTEHGASQCGFCTPGILMRLSALSANATKEKIDQALLAHLCRCTGWQTIEEATRALLSHPGDKPPPGGAPAEVATSARPRTGGAQRRAELEGGVAQRVGPEVALGGGGFAEDTAPPEALVAVPTSDGGWATGETLAEARKNAGKVQGRRTTIVPTHPLDVPEGNWDVTLRTTWVEPAYLEPDASWCLPGGEPASPLANGGAFGGKANSIAPQAAKRLAEEHQRPVRVVLSREDTVRLGPKRPPIAAGINRDGTGVIRVVRTPGIADAIHAVAPKLVVEEIDVAGPPTSSAIRAAGWAEAAVLLAAVNGRAEVTAPNGARAEATIATDGTVTVHVSAGRPLDTTILRSYCIGATHMAIGWVTSEGIAVDEEGRPHDLTIRSFGILRAKDMPHVEVRIDEDDDREPINGSDAVFAAVAAAAWLDRGLPTDWPTERGRTP
ncbi:MAG: xanthine dehydrogenase molybdenum-binding subunit [Actinomycetota bacterium]|jgi:aerobic-type carbon monoxide dehydrogenase small subunit (CoxS/CutS family)|nr:xanthine dehydrogenase molybdenum-binding subunit [Actinomycetota bacterium]